MGRVLICFLLFVIFCDKPFISVVITWSLLFKLSMFSCLSAQNLLSDAVTQFTSITICKSIYKTLFLDFE